MQKSSLNIESFVDSYLHTAAWLTCESGENNEFTKQGREIAKADCEKFIQSVQDRFHPETAEKLLTIEGNDLTYLAAHDLFLTRNRHGAGFWDKEDIYGEDNAVILTDIAHSLGEADCYHVKGKKSKLTF